MGNEWSIENKFIAKTIQYNTDNMLQSVSYKRTNKYWLAIIVIHH